MDTIGCCRSSTQAVRAGRPNQLLQLKRKSIPPVAAELGRGEVECDRTSSPGTSLARSIAWTRTSSASSLRENSARQPHRRRRRPTARVGGSVRRRSDRLRRCLQRLRERLRARGDHHQVLHVHAPTGVSAAPKIWICGRGRLTRSPSAVHTAQRAQWPQPRGARPAMSRSTCCRQGVTCWACRRGDEHRVDASLLLGVGRQVPVRSLARCPRSLAARRDR